MSSFIDTTPDVLIWLKRELKNNLVDMRQALEQYIHDASNKTQLNECEALMRSVRGALRIAQVDGANMLASEMLRLIHMLQNDQVLHRRDGLDALSRASFQLPAYLDRIMNTGQDVPLVVLPLVNDLRAARGATLMSEDTVFVLNVAGDAPLPEENLRNTVAIEAVAENLRKQFQLGLLGVIKSERVDSHLDVMLKITDTMARAAKQPFVYQLFWVAGGLIEAARENPMAIGASVKRLLGQVDRQIKRILDSGENAVSGDPPADLLNSMLYHVARTNSKSERIKAIRDAFKLEGVLPSQQMLDTERASLSGPSDDILQSVGKAIAQDLAGVKDALDIYVRTARTDITELKPQLDAMRRLANTLSLLGLPRLRVEVQKHRVQLDEFVRGQAIADENDLMKLAEGLIGVEQQLAQRLAKWAVTSEELSEAELEQQHTLMQIHAVVLRECLIEWSKLQDGLSAGLAGGSERQQFDRLPARVHLVACALNMLEDQASVELVTLLGQFIKAQVLHRDDVLPEDDLKRLADAIVAMEVYLTTWQATNVRTTYYLNEARQTLQVLQSSYPLDVQAEAEEKEVPSAVQTSPASPVVVDQPAEVGEFDWSQAIDPKAEVMPDALECFIEEVRELHDELPGALNAWQEAPDNRDALKDIRRAFHTIKGSGRMVGASVMGEFGWLMESLCNRLLVHRAPIGPAIVSSVTDAVALLPVLIEQLEVGTQPSHDLAAWSNTIQALADEHVQMATNDGQQAPPEAIQDAHEMALDDPRITVDMPVVLDEPAAPVEEVQEDQVVRDIPADVLPPSDDLAADTRTAELYEIFCNEAHLHVAELENYVADHPDSLPSAPVTDSLERALHTLRGSATMANIAPVALVVEPLHRFVQHRKQRDEPLQSDTLMVLGEATRWLASILQADQIAHTVAPADLIERIQDFMTIDLSAQAQAPSAHHEMHAVFSEEARELMDDIDAAIAGKAWDELKSDAWASLNRTLHTLKGSSRMVELHDIADFAHALEAVAERASHDVAFATQKATLLGNAFDRLHATVDGLHSDASKVNNLALINELNAAAQEVLASDTSLDALAVNLEAANEPVASFDEVATDAVPPVELPPVGSDPETLPELIREITADIDAVAKSASPIIPSSTVEEPRGENEPGEYARVRRALLDSLLTEAGEVSVVRGRLEQQVTTINKHLAELGRTVLRLREQLRAMEMETEAQVRFRPQLESGERDRDGFDPLELDRYSRVQQLSRSLAESVSDLVNLQDILEQSTQQAESLLVEQSRVTSDMQDGLIQARMVPMSQFVPRFERVVRQISQEQNKQVAISFDGAEREFDRQVLQRMLAPIEHMLRNAVIHGIESTAARVAAGKDATGKIHIRLWREASDLMLELSDDGRGLDPQRIKQKAIARGRLDLNAELSDQEMLNLITEPGFSTASELTQSAGRGVGMDVVASEVKQLGGRLEIRSSVGQGSTFICRLPATLAITHALMIRTGDEIYALPLPNVHGIARVGQKVLQQALSQEYPSFDYGDETFRLVHLGDWMGSAAPTWPSSPNQAMAVVMVHADDKPCALIVDEMLGSREVVIKPLNLQLANIRGLSGATILGDGRVSLVLDVPHLLRQPMTTGLLEDHQHKQDIDDRSLVLVVDDSITVRRVTQRLLERHNVRVITAKDGIEALTVLQEHTPHVVLLDIEMPRMDGFEVAAHIRGDEHLSTLPIVMITSRIGEKHKARAESMGVNAYLGKPYQESQLFATIEPFLSEPVNSQSSQSS